MGRRVVQGESLLTAARRWLSALLLRAHGFVAVAPTLQSAVFRAIFTVTSANIQHQALALGGNAITVSPALHAAIMGEIEGDAVTPGEPQPEARRANTEIPASASEPR